VEKNKENGQTRKGRWKLFLVLAICAAPLAASYFTYYVVKPEGRTNYGTILDPRQHIAPELHGETMDAKRMEIADLNGKWIMLQVDSANCEVKCQKKQYDIRQLRAAQGKNTDRIERVWLTTDSLKIDPKLLVGIEGTHIIKTDETILGKWLPVDEGTKIQDHIYIIDPLGNLMMRFPKDADANKIKKDLSKLLKASAIG
jgi:hypothetical protein